MDKINQLEELTNPKNMDVSSESAPKNPPQEIQKPKSYKTVQHMMMDIDFQEPEDPKMPLFR
jgi:hypothetical protein